MTRRRTVALLVFLVLVLAGAGVWRWRSGEKKPDVRMDTAELQRGRIVAKVTATGTLSAIVTVQVGSQVSGRIAALYADFNSVVRKGDRIAKIDPQLFEAAVAQARANWTAARGNLARAEAQAVDARRQLERATALAERNLIAPAERDTAQANFDVARAQIQAARGALEQARAALGQAQVNLAYTDILSPTDGVVISRNVDVGQTVAASLQAPVLFTIAEDLRKMQVNTSVPEADVGRLRDGMDATFTVDAYPAEIFRGRVRQIRNAPTTVQNVVTYDAVLDVDNAELKLRPGMTATVTFVYAQKNDVLRVPNAALRFRPPSGAQAFTAGRRPGAGAAPRDQGAGGAARAKGEATETPDQRTVWVMRDGAPVPVRIRTGISDGTMTEVVEGDVRPGDKVVTDAVGGSSGRMRGPRIL